MNHPQHEKLSLFHRMQHIHTPRNVNEVIATEHENAGLNKRVALLLTKIFQGMPTFWAIIAWIVLWITANATIVRFDPLPWPLLLCLASVPQLPLMIVIMVGQGLLGRKQELQADEQYRTTMKTYHDIEQVLQHLSAQDGELLRQTKALEEHTPMLVAITRVLVRASEKIDEKDSIPNV